MCGGKNDKHSLNDVIRYCPTTKEWEQMNSMPTARWSMAVVALSGHLYTIGGRNEDNAELVTVGGKN